jgi:hypothetical protein
MKIYPLLEHGHPIIDYESMKKLFDFSKHSTFCNMIGMTQMHG